MISPARGAQFKAEILNVEKRRSGFLDMLRVNLVL